MSLKSAKKIHIKHLILTSASLHGTINLATFSLKLMDPVGVTVEQWDIKGAWITDADFGGLDYTSGEPVEISLTVRPDECILRY